MKKLIQFVLMLLLAWPYLFYCWRKWECGEWPASFMGWVQGGVTDTLGTSGSGNAVRGAKRTDSYYQNEDLPK